TMARRFPTPWREEKFSGGYVVRDATGQALAYLYARSTESEAVEAKQLTFDEARRIAVNIARLPELLREGERNDRFWGQSGHVMLRSSFSAFGPKRTCAGRFCCDARS